METPNIKKESTEPKGFIKLPYVKGQSEKIRRLANKYQIRSVFTSKQTLRSVLTKTKPEGLQDTKNCIYSIPCECGKVYIGETKRPLNTRLEEHKKNCRLGETTKSGVANHVWDEQHTILWNETKIIGKEEHWQKRKFKEAVAMELKQNIFSQPSVTISQVWKSILRNDVHSPERLQLYISEL